uniref:Spore protein YkvP/CgeB glycosyl transferase-like domain-containing protein n=1 Tax=Aureoumbra lagunensis TaxID=44058 RepID=A0A7S3JSJ3_9STRA
MASFFRRLALGLVALLIIATIVTHLMYQEVVEKHENLSKLFVDTTPQKETSHHTVATSALDWAKAMRRERDEAVRTNQRLREDLQEKAKIATTLGQEQANALFELAEEAIVEANEIINTPRESLKMKSIQDEKLLPRTTSKMRSRGENLTKCYTIDDIHECVQPELQFLTPTKVYLVEPDSAKAGWRFQHLIYQGFDLHPKIEPTQIMSQADLILYMPVSTAIPPLASHGATATNLIVLDEADSPYFNVKISETSYLIYLKRSWVSKKDGVYTGIGKRYERNYFPMAYSVSDKYFDPFRTLSGSQRKLDIVCSNRPTERQPTRARIVHWVGDFLDSHEKYHGIAGEVNAAGRRGINELYFAAMRSSKIVVTANPSHWEGDFRFFEAVASGALVFVDEMYTPHPHPFIHKRHLIVYDNSDQDTFQNLLKYYLEHPEEARIIARAGLRHALRYHRAVSRMDWILRSAHEIATPQGVTAYTHTARSIAYDVNATTQVKPIIDIKSPAINVHHINPSINLGRRYHVTYVLFKFFF